MSRLILVPQYPTPMRYQEWWFSEFPINLSRRFEVITIGKNYPGFKNIQNSNPAMFSPVQEAINFEQFQILEYLNLELLKNDILLINDISFPGLFCNVLFHKKPSKVFSICHATSKNYADYFGFLRESKWLVESGIAKLCNKIFVATSYHKRKLRWNNTIVTALPEPNLQIFKEKKEFSIISVSRPSLQKVNKQVENQVEKDFGIITRKSCNSWEDYYKFLSKSKIVLSTAKEETFSYVALETMLNNSIFVAPKSLSYPEIVPNEFLYKDYNDLKKILYKILDGKVSYKNIPINKNLIDKFYDNISNIMENY